MSGEEEAFDAFSAGWADRFTKTTSELELFRLCFTEEMLQLVVEETNRFAEQVIESSLNPSRRQAKWTPLSKEDFLRYLLIRIVMGIDKKPQYRHYWSKGGVEEIITIYSFPPLMLPIFQIQL